jgi:formate-dependent nitrite reductase membrane component NrfD
MEPVIIWQDKWSEGAFVPLYLFFGGLTAGIFIVAVLADLISIKSKRLETLSKVAAYASVATLALAGFFLTIHLGKPERGLAFPLYFTNRNSWMTWGGWIVGMGSPLVVLYAALWYFRWLPLLRRLLGVVAIPLIGTMALYTGWLLSNAGFVPLWSPQYLPRIFLNSGLTTGLAAAGLVFLLAWPFLRPRGEDQDPPMIIRWLSVAVVVFILFELYELYAFMTYLRAGGAEHEAFGRTISPKGAELAYEYVTKGALAPWFWWGVIAVGLAIPLLISVLEFTMGLFDRPWFKAVATTKFALILIGGVILRFVIVWGGEMSAPLEVPISQGPPTVFLG